jgi:NADPH:quinone reductase-like Zn-dependent oxidoreductase
MKAVVIREHGGLDKLEYIENFPVPEYNSHEVLIRVKACALNHLDIFTRKGIPGVKLKMPHVPGSDVAGIIEKVGSDVENWSVGDRVVINPGMWCEECEFCLMGEHSLCKKFHLVGEHIPGGYAEYLRVPARNLLKIPDNISFEDAAGAALSLLTAYRMLIKRGGLKKGETVLVIGASGGVSIFAIQLAKLFGATVYATTSSKFKMDKLKDLGVDEVFNYVEDETWWKSLYLKTGKRGVDVVVDSVGQATWSKSLRTLRKGGRLLTCGATTGSNGNTNINLVFWNQLHIIGSTMANHQEFIEAMTLLFEHKIKVPKRIFPLKEAKEAQQFMENKSHFGKIILSVE